MNPDNRLIWQLVRAEQETTTLLERCIIGGSIVGIHRAPGEHEKDNMLVEHNAAMKIWLFSRQSGVSGYKQDSDHFSAR